MNFTISPPRFFRNENFRELGLFPGLAYLPGRQLEQTARQPWLQPQLLGLPNLPIYNPNPPFI